MTSPAPRTTSTQVSAACPETNSPVSRGSSSARPIAATASMSAGSKPSKKRSSGRNGRHSNDGFSAWDKSTIAALRAGRSSAAGCSRTLAFSTRSFAASTCVSARDSSSAAGSRLATSARKSSRSTNQPRTSARAVTVAEHTPRSISAISPKMSPSRSSATVSMPPPGIATCASTSPASMMKAPRVASPCSTRRSPAANVTGRETASSFAFCCRSDMRASVHSRGLSDSIDPNRLLAVVAEVARQARPHVEAYVALDSSLERDLGLDSLARVELVLRIEREFAASLPEQALASSETPRDLLRFVLASAGQAPQSADRTVTSLVQSEGVRPPDAAKTLTEALEYHVERQPDRLSVHLYDERGEHAISYRALYEGSLAYAARLVEAGLQPGQTGAIMLPTPKGYLFFFYGTLLAGGIPVPLYPPARLTTIEDHLTRHVGILKSAAATLMVTIPEAKALAWLLRAQVESLRAVLMPGDFTADAKGFAPVRGGSGQIGFLQYTSGSTGQPKRVVLTHADLLANARAMGRAARAGSADVFVSWLPLYHDLR